MALAFVPTVTGAALAIPFVVFGGFFAALFYRHQRSNYDDAERAAELHQRYSK
jgi:biopolymer transport protein ExbB/TolQ